MSADLGRVRARLHENTDGTIVVDRGTPVPGRLSPSLTPTRTPAMVDSGAIARRRASQIEQHLDEASGHFKAGRYEDAIDHSEQALVIDPQQARALEILHLTRRALDARQVRQWLDEAETLKVDGALTGAERLITQSLQLEPDSLDAQSSLLDLKERRRRRDRAPEGDTGADSGKLMRSASGGIVAPPVISAPAILSQPPPVAATGQTVPAVPAAQAPAARRSPGKFALLVPIVALALIAVVGGWWWMSTCCAADDPPTQTPAPLPVSTASETPSPTPTPTVAPDSPATLGDAGRLGGTGGSAAAVGEPRKTPDATAVASPVATPVATPAATRQVEPPPPVANRDAEIKEAERRREAEAKLAKERDAAAAEDRKRKEVATLLQQARATTDHAEAIKLLKQAATIDPANGDVRTSLAAGTRN